MVDTPRAPRAQNTPTPPETTAGDMQLGPIHPAMTDLLCWIYAAAPVNPRTGRPDAHRVAKILNVAPATVYRWIRTADTREFDAEALAVLRNRALLRGHGDILWPGIDAVTANRHRSMFTKALAFHDNMRRDPTTAAALKARKPTKVITYYNDAAKVFGIITSTSDRTRDRLLAEPSGNTIVDQITVFDTYTAAVIKYAVLQFMGDDRCIAPEGLLHKGRTEVWRRRSRGSSGRYITDVDLNAFVAPFLS